jgi:hypoxanthine phosphoribosyltransferase
MNDPFYSYAARKGIRPISWNDFFGICKGLALAAESFRPEIILGIIRGGLYPATLVSHFLRVDVWPIRVTRRQNDRVISETPQWIIRPPAEVAGKRVLIVDEICSEGHTLRMAKGETERLGAAAILTAVMYSHTWGQHVPDIIGLISDELILNPWDREIVEDGAFVLHPEYAHAFAQQGIIADDSLRIGVPPYPIAKPTITKQINKSSK